MSFDLKGAQIEKERFDPLLEKDRFDPPTRVSAMQKRLPLSRMFVADAEDKMLAMLLQQQHTLSTLQSTQSVA